MQNIVSTDASNEDTLVGVFNTVLEKFKQTLGVRLPCVVTAINKAKNTVSVIPLIKMILSDDSSVQRAIIVGVPIQHLSAGGFIIHLPVKVGDFGYIRSCDRDISLFKQRFSESVPNTKRKITFEDSIFIPDTINHNNWDINVEDDNNLVIQTYDNSVKISLGSDNIQIKAPAINLNGDNEINLTSPLVNINGDNEINLTSPLVNIDGDITTTGTLKNNDVNVGSTHVHIQTNNKPTTVPE